MEQCEIGQIMATLAEQETSVSVGRLDSEVQIWTNVPKHLNRLRKRAGVTEIDSGHDQDGT